MEDVIEERSIEKLCGYVLCKKSLTAVINHCYHISTKKNKVYDITRRKLFCSNFCYSAANYLLEQMLTSPLWLRKEEEIAIFHFLPVTHQTKDINPGEVMVFSENLISNFDTENNEFPDESMNKEKLDLKNQEESSKPKRTLREESQIQSKQLSDVVEKDKKPLIAAESADIIDTVEISRVHENTTSQDKLDTLSIIEKNIVEKENVSSKITNIETVRNKSKNIKTSITNNCVMKDISERVTTDSVIQREFQINQYVQYHKEKKNNASKVSNPKKSSNILGYLVERIEGVFKEWITEDTYNLLFGNDEMKLEIFEKIRKQEKYASICKKLNQLQIEESINLESPSRVASKALPNYSLLQEKGKELQLKVQAFYGGCTEFEVPEEKNAENNENENLVFPLTESIAPKAIRRRILLDKINSVLPDLLRTFSGIGQPFLYNKEKVTKVKALISTFHLTPDNIVFNSAEWNLMALIIIKMLIKVDKELDKLLKTEQASLYTSMILMSYQLRPDYLDTFINNIIKDGISLKTVQ